MFDKYWKTRAKKYNKLNWVNNNYLLEQLIKFSNIKKEHIIMDAGCGTGVLTNYLVKKVKEIIAVDISPEMLKQVINAPNVKKYSDDFTNYSFSRQFNVHRIISRMVFHHLSNFNKVFSVCNSLLKPGGMLIIEEGGVYPTIEIRNWFASMMKLKEDRHNFTIDEIIQYYNNNSFKNVTYEIYQNDNFSIKNWLDNSGQSKSICSKIYAMHKNAPQFVKDFYDMKIIKDDIIITTNVVFLRGEK